MNAHTPGPWIKKGTQIRKGEFYLASSRQSGLPPEEAAANARLIAAAPELLDALQEIAHGRIIGERSDLAAMQRMMGIAISAIAKAEGKQ